MACYFCHKTNVSQATYIEVCIRHRLILWFKLIVLVARTRPLKACWRIVRWWE